MTFQKATSWQERGLQLEKVQNKCNYIIKSLNLPRDDARRLGIIHVRQLCNTLAFTAIKLQQKREDKKYRPTLLELFDLKDIKGLESFLKDSNSNFKISFITIVQFALENCIRRVLESLLDRQVSDSFWKISKRLIDRLELENANQKHRLIMVPAWIRNILHYGGIYRREDKTVVIDGESYIFIKNQRFGCASWSHIFHAFLHSLNVYEEILCSTQVRATQRIESE